MNKLLLLLCFTFMSFSIFGQFINEIHYDNSGGDVGEGVEVYFPNPQPSNLADYSVVLYNGNGGITYGSTLLLSDFTAVAGAAGTYYFIMEAGIQNGGPDGLALVGPTGTIQFLSYEGSFMATNGPAMGLTSTDIGASETSSAAIGTSIQLGTDGTWTSGEATTWGAINTVGLLPIELKSFRVSALENDITLNWTTVVEENNSHFNILHSANGRAFSEIATVNGNGFSNEEMNYSYEFKNATNGMHYFQLEQVDFNGDSEKFDIETIEIRTGKDITIYPSTTEAILNVNGLSSDSDYVIFTIVGQVVQKGLTNGTINVNQLTTGTYFIQINGNSMKFFKN